MFLYTLVLSMYIYAGSSVGLGGFGQWFSRDEQPAQVLPCGVDTPPRHYLTTSTSGHLRKLAEYEQACASAFADTQMVFSGMPTTDAEAVRLGNQLATKLKEFDEYTVRPLVILEPVRPDGSILSMADAAQGAYDVPMTVFFRTLKQRDITDGMMGTWVPFPEANTPVWHSTDAQLFVQAVTHVVKLQKQAFPDSKASLMLGSQTYPTGDVGWANGAFVSLKPYVTGFPEGLVDSFGYQGFPWRPPAGTDGYELMDPRKFLRTDYAIEAAETLGVRSVWFNTGTFARSHTVDPTSETAMSVSERSRMLLGIFDQARVMQRRGFAVAINIFAEDKSATPEGVDWSYWQPGGMADSPARPALTVFIKRANEQGIPVWIFDDDQHARTSVSSAQHR